MSTNKYRDYYSMLGVRRSATKKEIHDAYLKQAFKWHPDRNHSPEAEETFRHLEEAHYVLSDEERRRNYDLSNPESAHPDPPTASNHSDDVYQTKMDDERSDSETIIEEEDFEKTAGERPSYAPRTADVEPHISLGIKAINLLLLVVITTLYVFLSQDALPFILSLCPTTPAPLIFWLMVLLHLYAIGFLTNHRIGIAGLSLLLDRESFGAIVFYFWIALGLSLAFWSCSLVSAIPGVLVLPVVLLLSVIIFREWSLWLFGVPSFSTPMISRILPRRSSNEPSIQRLADRLVLATSAIYSWLVVLLWTAITFVLTYYVYDFSRLLLSAVFLLTDADSIFLSFLFSAILFLNLHGLDFHLPWRAGLSGVIGLGKKTYGCITLIPWFLLICRNISMTLSMNDPVWILPVTACETSLSIFISVFINSLMFDIPFNSSSVAKLVSRRERTH